jgi:hypothetical protein
MHTLKLPRGMAKHRKNRAGRMALSALTSTHKLLTYTKYTLAGETVTGHVIDVVINVVPKRGECECMVEVTPVTTPSCPNTPSHNGMLLL